MDLPSKMATVITLTDVAAQKIGTLLSDDEISAELTAVKGIGQWSADMFLIFFLGRPDVLPVGDLGVRRAAGVVYALPEMPAPEALFELGEPWRPHRSLASLYLWRSLDNEPQ